MNLFSIITNRTYKIEKVDSIVYLRFPSRDVSSEINRCGSYSRIRATLAFIGAWEISCWTGLFFALRNLRQMNNAFYCSKEKYFVKIFSPIRENKIWRRRTNRERAGMLWWKSRKYQAWMGPDLWSKEEILYKLLQEVPDHKKGGPKLRWFDSMMLRQLLPETGWQLQ